MKRNATTTTRPTRPRRSRWDEDKLPLELMALQDADFDLSMLGFPDKELMRLWARNALESHS